VAESDANGAGQSMNWYYDLLRPLMVLVGWIMAGTHWLLSQFLNPDSGLVWVASIVVLVIVMRIAMIPLFVKQIRSQRGMQLMQPDMQKIQKKYKGKTDPISRQRQQEEMMALYRKHGTNPFSSCLPILLQSPFFVALFGLLNNLKPVAEGKVAAIGSVTQELARSAESATVFGAPLSATFTMADQATGGVSPLTVKIVTVVLIVAMSVTTFITQRQLTMKNIPEAAQDNPMFRAQKMMLYVFPLFFAFAGINFPIGVLVYWLTTNLWSMGQQFLVIRRMPAPGSQADKRLQERRAARAAKKGHEDETKGEVGRVGGRAGEALADGGSAAAKQRQQPRKQSRAQRKSKAGQGRSRQTTGDDEGKASKANAGGPTRGKGEPRDTERQSRPPDR
jgi:YidC/Oxa1 family membrane protein insertase